MNINKKIFALTACVLMSLGSVQAKEDSTSEDKACDNISALGNMIMQVRQYKPDVTSEFLLTKVNEKPSAQLSGRERQIFERSQTIASDVIKQAFEKDVVKGDDNKKNAIIAFQVQVYDYCIKQMK